MEINRRSVIKNLCVATSAFLSGCAGISADNKDTAINSKQPNNKDTTINSTQSLSECSSINGNFDTSVASKPSNINKSSVELPVVRIEMSYQEDLDILPNDLPYVSDSATIKQYRISDAKITKQSSDKYKVVVEADVRYNAEDDHSNNTVHYDSVVAVATYCVTSDYVERKSGVGNLTGKLLCW